MAVTLVNTKGWLLQKVPLANDDTLLIFLTEDWGKIKVFASKLQRSKKKSAELDYFRWLELNLARPKNTYKLQGLRALSDFSPNIKGYDRLELSFNVLAHVAQFCPEEKSVPDVIQLLHEFFTLESLPPSVLAPYFYTKLLWFSGVLPRFDLVRSRVWIHPVTLVFTDVYQAEAIEITNEQRQILEWLRRHQAKDLLETYTKFPEHDLVILQAFLRAVIENH